MLQDADGTVLYAVLDSVPSGDLEMLYPLRGYIQREVSNLHFLRSLLDTLSRDGRSSSLLVDTLAYRLAKSEERLIKAVGLFGNAQALNLIRKSLNAGDASTRAAALEALETLGDRKITQEILPILDRGGVFHRGADRLDLNEAIEQLLLSEDHWLRALAARSVPELGLKDHAELLRKLQSDRDPLVKQAAHDALLQMDGKKMKTLKTLSTMDRILLLREVPMFAGLAPEDLERIAEIAQERLYSQHALICREGDPGDSLFIVVSGEVEVVKSLGADEKILAVRKVGEFVGEMAILDSAPRSAALRAMNEVRVLSIEGDAFNMILLDRPEVAVSVLRNMSARVRELNEKVGAHG
jgi:CRP-like cAMP-binding protein